MVKSDFWSFRPKHRQLQRLYLEALWDTASHGIVSAPHKTSCLASAPQSPKGDAVKLGACVYVGEGCQIRDPTGGLWQARAAISWLLPTVLQRWDQKPSEIADTELYPMTISLSISLVWWTVCSKVFRALQDHFAQWPEETLETRLIYLRNEGQKLLNFVRKSGTLCSLSLQTLSVVKASRRCPLCLRRRGNGEGEKVPRRHSEWIYDINSQLFNVNLFLFAHICNYF